jgi:hypothetical protein
MVYAVIGCKTPLSSTRCPSEDRTSDWVFVGVSKRLIGFVDPLFNLKFSIQAVTRYTAA